MGTSVAVTVLLLWVTWYVLVVVPAFVPRTILPVPAPVIIFAPLSVVYGAPKWHRCENRLLHAGTLRRRVHPPHLHPRHTAKARRGRTDNGQLHGTGHVTSYPLIFSPFRTSRRVGQGVGQRKQRIPEKFQKHAKTPRNQTISGCFWSW